VDGKGEVFAAEVVSRVAVDELKRGRESGRSRRVRNSWRRWSVRVEASSQSRAVFRSLEGGGVLARASRERVARLMRVASRMWGGRAAGRGFRARRLKVRLRRRARKSRDSGYWSHR